MTPVEWCRVTTPMQVEAWEAALRTHTDKTLVSYLVRGLSQGFHIGFEYGAKMCKPASKNMKSAEVNPAVVDEYLAKEKATGRVML